MSNYKKTLHLPRTKFPMKANLTQNEPKILKFWQDNDIYSDMVKANEGHDRYTLHDGPPYANAHIHLGTAMNKVLKDIVVKSKNMKGLKAEYVPGWDCHGLPIEYKVGQELKEKGKTDLPPLTIRKICRDYAAKWQKIQSKEFERLGVLGTWDNPYLTMKPEYEAATTRELGNFMGEGSVVRNKKPIYWCNSCKTALAEAEVEYAPHTSPSIFVRFALRDEKVTKFLPVDPAKTYVCIWTTTPWTLPSNMAIALHKDYDYACVKVNDEFYILADKLLEDCAAKFGWESYEKLAVVKGSEFEGLKATHCFYDRDSLMVLADYVTLESGTGCVHTAPGHGPDDYMTGYRYGLEIYSPLNDEGRFLPTVEFFGGLTVDDANPKVIEKLEEVGNLLAQQKISHSYPHCWRCKKPVIYRATTQWFISMENNALRKKSLKAIDEDVQWIPAWGRGRIHNMVEMRPDWCISRQRTWGVPITALLCEDCGEAWFSKEWVLGLAEKMAQHPTGCDYWFEAPLEEIVPSDLKCPHCGGQHWKKENNILDVWFDSGTSFSAVVEQRDETVFPADLYLEGSDQHRGWFHSSLLASMGTRGKAPYKSVLTHGYVVDGEGKKMSKSVGNVVAPQEIIDKYGADILRMWVSSENYQADVRVSDDILKRLVDAYRRIRNTIRFILGNINDFDPAQHAVKAADMLPVDRYAMTLINDMHEQISKAYDDFEFHRVYHTVHNMCITELSAFYLDILKDRLYVSAANSHERRSAQTALWQIMLQFLSDIAPVVSFTAEETFSHLPEAVRPDVPTVFAMRFAMDKDYLMDEEEKNTWDTITAIRSEIQKAIEPQRKDGVVGHSLDTAITVYANEELIDILNTTDLDLRELCIVSQIHVAKLAEAPEDAYTSTEVEGLRISVAQAKGEKCQRCWVYCEELGTDAEHPDLCPRCAAVMKTEA
ncbi:isoleucine--tRNA ligase [Desulfobaculum bizertense]|uniref:Isoleucine--tRNA ligase n=1 Tax=Desulfobaculum bizertense DSM 18034 TaxID=1121442 RepID=A0A1T4W2A4_9BACT|nr:isoleucine--tRNA ligase [Desulfobaculum bizertense]SKA71400.1 Isoleucyl-tRNA synthetase [Desulfobaculum bizertense DSM 18034]